MPIFRAAARQGGDFTMNVSSMNSARGWDHSTFENQVQELPYGHHATSGPSRSSRITNRRVTIKVKLRVRPRRVVQRRRGQEDSTNKT